MMTLATSDSTRPLTIWPPQVALGAVFLSAQITMPI